MEVAATRASLKSSLVSMTPPMTFFLVAHVKVICWRFDVKVTRSNCYAKDIMEGTDHGVRNSFWFAFQGKGQDGKGGDH